MTTRGAPRRARHAGRAAAAGAAAAARCSRSAASRWTRSGRRPASRPRSPTTWSTTSRARDPRAARATCATAARRSMRRALELPGLDHAHGAARSCSASLEFAPYPGRRARRSRELRERGLRSWWRATGTARCPDWLGPRGAARARGRRGHLGRGRAPPSPIPRVFERALGLARRASPARRVHVGDSVENDVAGARAAGIRAVLLARDGAAAGRGGGDPLARRAARPTLRADAARTRAAASAADPPELPEPARAALAGLVRGRSASWPALIATLRSRSGIVWRPPRARRRRRRRPAFDRRRARFLQGASFIGDGRCCSPRSRASRAPGTSGCGRTRFWPAVGWAALGLRRLLRVRGGLLGDRSTPTPSRTWPRTSAPTRARSA